MARIRTIKPTHVNDKQLANIQLQSHLLWILLWCFSDDEGVFEHDAILIKSQVFPRRTDITIDQIEEWLDELERARFIISFDYNNEQYYVHRTFKSHQKIDKPQGSKVPKDRIQSVLQENSTNVRRTVAEDSSNVRGSVALYSSVEYSNSKRVEEDSPAQKKEESDSVKSEEEKENPQVPRAPLYNTAEHMEQELSEIDVGGFVQYAIITCQAKAITGNRIRELWRAFKIQHFGEKVYKDFSDCKSHFLNSLKFMIQNGNESTGRTKQNAGKSAGALSILDDLKADYGITDERGRSG
jgi:hypothetical protein